MNPRYVFPPPTPAHFCISTYTVYSYCAPAPARRRPAPPYALPYAAPSSPPHTYTHTPNTNIQDGRSDVPRSAVSRLDAYLAHLRPCLEQAADLLSASSASSPPPSPHEAWGVLRAAMDTVVAAQEAGDSAGTHTLSPAPSTCGGGNTDVDGVDGGGETKRDRDGRASSHGDAAKELNPGTVSIERTRAASTLESRTLMVQGLVRSAKRSTV